MANESLKPRTIGTEALMPTTSYFEIDSLITHGRYAVWVTLPVGYSAESGSCPVVYVQDGNLLAPFIGCFNKVMPVDVICPIKPFIAVSIGYTPDDAPHCSSLRMRDLIPPGEPVNPIMIQALEHNVASGLMTKEEKDSAIEGMTNNRADLFLEFICKELHPQILKAYNVDQSDIGLFGYSYGGLFALYSALNENAVFNKIGACSPGMLTENTTIMSILKNLQDNKVSLSGRKLLMTVNEKELTAPTFYQTLGACFASVSKSLGEKPVGGLTLTSSIIPGTTHVTGTTAAWFRFIHEYYIGRQ